MTSRYLIPLLLLSAAVPAAAQNAAKPTAPATGQPTLPTAMPPAAAPLPPPPIVVAGHWSKRDAGDLLAFVQGIGEEGLDPADYGPDILNQALGNEGPALDAMATQTFLKVASDLSFGHVRGDGRVDWHVHDDVVTPADQQA